MRDVSAARRPLLLVLTAGAALVVTACTGSSPETPETTTATSSSSRPTETSRVALEDPLAEMQRRGTFPDADVERPLVHEHGRGAATYELSPASSKGSALITVTCPTGEDFEVTSGAADGQRLLAGACAPSLRASITLPRSTIGSRITVTTPGDHWVAVVRTS